MDTFTCQALYLPTSINRGKDFFCKIANVSCNNEMMHNLAINMQCICTQASSKYHRYYTGINPIATKLCILGHMRLYGTTGRSRVKINKIKKNKLGLFYIFCGDFI